MEIGRRDALKYLAGSLALHLVGCGKEEKRVLKDFEVGGRKYTFDGNLLRQVGGVTERSKFGIITDPHANVGNARYFAGELNKSGVNCFLYGGDLSHSFGDREGVRDDAEEIIGVIEPAASYGDNLVLCIPGNHEPRNAYRKALDDVASVSSNVIDMERFPVVDLDDVTIVALGGNANAGFCIDGGFLRRAADSANLERTMKGYVGKKPVLLFTHVPQLYETKRGLDRIDRNGEHVGWGGLTRVKQVLKPEFHVFGHIHEFPGMLTEGEGVVKSGEFVERLDFKPGAVYDHLRRKNLKPAAGIMEIVDKKARAWILNR